MEIVSLSKSKIPFELRVIELVGRKLFAESGETPDRISEIDDPRVKVPVCSV